MPIRINSLDIVLYPAFVKNPADCALATTPLLVTSYEDPGYQHRLGLLHAHRLHADRSPAAATACG